MQFFPLHPVLFDLYYEVMNMKEISDQLSRNPNSKSLGNKYRRGAEAFNISEAKALKIYGSEENIQINIDVLYNRTGET